jgi:hypothetical protein
MGCTRTLSFHSFLQTYIQPGMAYTLLNQVSPNTCQVGMKDMLPRM